MAHHILIYVQIPSKHHYQITGGFRIQEKITFQSASTVTVRLYEKGSPESHPIREYPSHFTQIPFTMPVTIRIPSSMKLQDLKLRLEIKSAGQTIFSAESDNIQPIMSLNLQPVSLNVLSDRPIVSQTHGVDLDLGTFVTNTTSHCFSPSPSTPKIECKSANKMYFYDSNTLNCEEVSNVCDPQLGIYFHTYVECRMHCLPNLFPRQPIMMIVGHHPSRSSIIPTRYNVYGWPYLHLDRSPSPPGLQSDPREQNGFGKK
ncbi:unnamed protein product [Didymodactylos carnosus]|uniref:Uncharacterized protein n=1 Tax=Didymodactylos carnosus TaxID=1234261 RepID=A0A813ZSI0_9BILA|nr:unnamed protein product [Didymodactylos carnosus]CAF3685118.1 unnamed protein product [Didymodactylos carnosus]